MTWGCIKPKTNLFKAQYMSKCKLGRSECERRWNIFFLA